WLGVTSIVPNKPMVPTATSALNRYALPSRRRHIGQPLGRQRSTRSKGPYGVQRAAGDTSRPLGGSRRASGDSPQSKVASRCMMKRRAMGECHVTESVMVRG
ncbi:MAG: hypothetical protein R3A48_24780, partial [Polyangiales bacterium]